MNCSNECPLDGTSAVKLRGLLEICERVRIRLRDRTVEVQYRIRLRVQNKEGSEADRQNTSERRGY
jgi:hypothetical protein